MKKYIIKYLWQPINNILGNHLIQSLLSYFSFKLLETNQANQYLANTMLFFALFALLLYALEKIFGIKTPLVNVGKIFKAFRQSAKLENMDNIGKSIDMTLEQSKKLYKKYERIGKKMKKVGQWLKLNYAPLLSFMAFVLYVLDNYLGWTDKWNLPSEWYYAITAIIIIIVGIGIKSKGFKGITLGELISEVINDFTLQKTQLKQENKQRVDKAKLQMKTQPMVDVLKNSLKEEILKELKGEQSPIKPNQAIPLTKAEVEAKYGPNR